MIRDDTRFGLIETRIIPGGLVFDLRAAALELGKEINDGLGELGADAFNRTDFRRSGAEEVFFGFHSHLGNHRAGFR